MTLNHFCLLVILTTTAMYAASPKTVKHDSKNDFERGAATNVTILHDGVLLPAPVKQRLFDTGQPFVWSMIDDDKGNLYIGTGNEGKLFKLAANGDTSLVLDADELGIFALAVDSKNNVYAASAPNGRVYKINSAGRSETFFDPDATYIWDLQVDKNDNVYAATGEKAFIYKVTPAGQSSTIFTGEENHVRTIVLAGETIYAGTSSNGYIYRIRPGEKPFVLFDPQMEEVHGLVLGENGELYASVINETLILPPATRQQQQQQQQASPDGGEEEPDAEAALAAQTANVEALAATGRTQTSLFRITPDGFGKDLWLGADDRIQSMIAYGKDNVLVGSGRTGELLTVDAKGQLSILLENDETHISALLRNRKNQVMYGTSNLGRVYRLETALADSASFVSETIDAGLPATWGALQVDNRGDQTGVAFFTRSGNTEQPSSTWSDWQPVEKDGDVLRIKSPGARFVQWKCLFSAATAQVDKVSLSYLQKNLPPEVSSLIVHPQGDFYEGNPGSGKKGKGITFPAPLTNKQVKKGFRTIDWLFDDPNFDALCFDLYYRRLGSVLWRELAKDLEVNIYTWDSAQMADGQYEIKVVASDKCANPEETAKTGEYVGKPFIVDNAGPAINTGNNKNENVLTVKLIDDWNPIGKVEYSLDAQEWKIIYPVDGVLDAKVESFEITVPVGEHDVAIRAGDVVDNVSVVHVSLK